MRASAPAHGGDAREDRAVGSGLWWEAASVFAGGVCLAFVLLLPGSLRLATHLPDDGDALQGVWILWWGATHLTGGFPALLDGNVYHPHPGALLFSEPLLTQAALAAPLFGLTDNRVLIVNVVMLVSLASNAAAFHVLARGLGGSRPASAAASVLYAFNTYVFGQLARVQLLSLAWLPLALWALHRLARGGRVRYAWAFALFLALLGFSCLYYLAFSALVLAVAVPAAFWSSPQLRRRPVAAHLIAAAAAAAALLAPLASAYRTLFDRYGFTAEREPFHLRRFLVPNAGTLLYPDPKEPGDVFLGYAAVVMAALGLVSLSRWAPLERRMAKAIAAAALVAALIAPWPEWRLGPLHAPAPLALLGALEPFSRVRDSARLAAVVYLGLSLLAVPAIERLVRPLRGAGRLAAALAISALLLAEHWTPGYRGVEVPVPPRLPPAYGWLAAQPGGAVVAELPPRPFHLIRFTALEAYLSTFHGHRVLFGRPSFFPPALEMIQWELRNFPDATSLALLRGLGVRWALVHPERWGESWPRQRRRLEERADRLPLAAWFPADPGPVWARYDLGGERIYEVRSAAEEREPRRCRCEEVPRGDYRLAGNGATSPALAADGRRDTRWTTGDGQEEGPFHLELRFARPRRPVRVEVEAAFPYGEFARELTITGHLGAEAWRLGPRPDPWYTARLVRQLAEDPAHARLRYDLDARTVDRLRLVAGGYRGGLAWSVPEIHVFEGELLED